MSEILGGSRGKGGNNALAKAMALTKNSSMSGTGSQYSFAAFSGAANGRAMTARGPAPSALRAAGDHKMATMPARPSSAPRERGAYRGGGGGSGKPLGNGNTTADARARVEELRQIKEAQFWGREQPMQRELPAYWSMATYGQPFNDWRLAMGATNVYQVLEPATLKTKPHDVVGPATEQTAMMRMSLEDGKRYFNRADLSPLKEGAEAEKLSKQDRLFLLNKMTPYQRIHALRFCMDTDQRAPDFEPWTQMVWSKLDAKFWRRNRAMAIRLAVQKLENLMRRHLQYLSDQKCREARAPSARPQDILLRAFWKVDPAPHRTNTVSIAQFMQVWQNVLMLLEYTDDIVSSSLNSKSMRVALKPGKRFLLDESMCAAIFIKYGFDKDGLMPYIVFIQALCATPARLLGQEIVLDKKELGKHGLSDDVDIAYCVGDAKVLYPKCETGVFPPSGFDPRLADRSRMLPKAHMWLEHVYGYAGHDTNASNLFYTKNTTSNKTEVVYYSGQVGIVFCKEDFDQGRPSQRFFFGHDNDIQCLTIHPSRKYVATGQQKATGPQNVPYVCIWDVDECNQLQKLEHDEEERSVIAVCFSGNPNANKEDKIGGEVLVTVTADDKHTIHVWRWMNAQDKFCKAVNIPGWCYGPTKKIEWLKTAGWFYDNPEKYDEETRSQKKPKGDKKPMFEPPRNVEVDGVKYSDAEEFAKKGRHPLLDRVNDPKTHVQPTWEWGLCMEMPRGNDDKTWSYMPVGPGCNGTPPMVYGIVWNPLRPSDGKRGSEFCSYGVKHLKTWIVNDQEAWQGTSGSFGNEHIENVLSACYVPAMHFMAAPGDSCLLTGFASGQIGLWLPPYPTRAGATYQLSRKFDAHGPGALLRLQDGTQVYGGVRVIKLRADPTGQDPYGRILVTGGSDGYVISWQLEPVTGVRKDGTPLKGTNLKCLATAEEHFGPNRFCLESTSSPYDPNAPARVVGLDCHPAKPDEFIAGTSDNDIWEVDKDPRIMVEGQEEDIWHVATHPEQPEVFATTCESGKIRVWNMKKFDVVLSANVGFPITGVAFSNERYYSNMNQAERIHLAVGSMGSYQLGNWHKIAILDSTTLQPLKILKEPNGQVSELKYSPKAGPQILAAGAHDMHIYLFNAGKDYQFIAKCVGHSGTIQHIDWSLPISLPSTRLHGQMIIMSTDNSGNLLFWDPSTGRKIAYNQRDAPMATWTCKLGFPVMGIWPDDTGLDDINAVCASNRGMPAYKPAQKQLGYDPAACVETATDNESADGVATAGYLVTADDFSSVRLFNFPVVWDDAPHKIYRGHASHIMCARFSCDDRAVVTTGGHDRGIYQWRTLGVNKDDWQKDNLIMEAIDIAIRNRRDGDAAYQPNPGVEWAALDNTGRIYGPKAVAEEIAVARTMSTMSTFSSGTPKEGTSQAGIPKGGIFQVEPVDSGAQTPHAPAGKGLPADFMESFSSPRSPTTAGNASLLRTASSFMGARGAPSRQNSIMKPPPTPVTPGKVTKVSRC